jgi:hypothetical protein
MKTKNAWRWWAKAIGEKASKDDKESDIVAIIRTIIFATYLITNAFIISGVIRHWNNLNIIEIHYEVPSDLQQKEKERIFSSGSHIL